MCHVTKRRASVIVLACLALVAVGCRDLRFLVPPASSGDGRYHSEVFTQVTMTSDIIYGSSVNQQGQTVSLGMDLYEPSGDSFDARPAIVWVHGGSFRSGSKASPEIVDQANVFARKGYVNVSISYRLSPNGCTVINAECITAIIDAKHDAQAAVRYLRANASTLRIDTTRIAIAGTSAGAITALNVGYGPEDPGTSGSPGFDSSVSAAVSLSGARLLTTANAGEAAALLFHGTADSLVPHQWAVDTVAEAKGAGLTAYLTTWDGAGHVPYVQNRTAILDQTSNFLYWTLTPYASGH